MFSVVFGDLIDALGGSPTIAQLVHEVNKVGRHASHLSRQQLCYLKAVENSVSVHRCACTLCTWEL